MAAMVRSLAVIVAVAVMATNAAKSNKNKANGKWPTTLYNVFSVQSRRQVREVVIINNCKRFTYGLLI